MKLIDFFDHGAARDPARDCLRDEHGARSYAQVQAMTHRIANACRREGILPHAKVAVFSPNAARAFECVLGFIRAGCVWVPVNARNALDEIVYALNLTECEVLAYHSSLTDKALEIRERCPKLRVLVVIDEGAGASGHHKLDDWIKGLPETSEEVEVAPEALATLFCTGGTTGYPKAVMATHRNWENRIAATLLRAPCEWPVQLVAAPMTHAAGAGALELMALGSTTVILPGFEAGAVIDAIGRHQVTHLFLPPTAIYRLLVHPEVRRGDYRSLRYFTYAAAPMAVDKLKEAIEVFGPVMEQGYGSTEMGTSACSLQPKDHQQALAQGNDALLTSCGRPCLLTRVGIMDDEGRFVPRGTMGEIVVKSTSTAVGYYNNPKETARAFTEGWYHTGDVGYQDEQGWVYIRDRKKDLIISGGFNIYPSEVERVLLSHPAVMDCAVIGVPHADWGEAVAAIVEAKPGHTVDGQDLQAWAKERLSFYKVPKQIEVRELPRSPVGKVLKRVLRDAYWEGRERRI